MKEKIDIIGEMVYVYDQSFELIKSVDLSTVGTLSFLNEDVKLLTINITQPVKRVITFTKLNDIDSSAEFSEFIYDEMSVEQKSEVDNFISLL